MKKFLSIIFAILLTISCVAAVGCNTNDGADEPLKMGLGIYTAYESFSNADGETNGSANVVTTAAVILLDKENKIVKCAVDTIDCGVSYTSEGVGVVAEKYQTKAEKGMDYGMSKYGADLNNDGVVKEWFEQADAFCSVAEGKTLDEVKALVVNGYAGNNEIISAGCTIGVADFVKAFENAFANAIETNATKNDKLSLGFVANQEKKTDASDEVNGHCEVVTNVCASAVDANGKVSAIKIDTAFAEFEWTAEGVIVTDKTDILFTKRKLGYEYGMSKYGADLNNDGVVKEWFEQIDVLEAACIGKNADEITALVTNGNGVDSLQTAGCTMAISDIVEAVLKTVK